MPRCEYSYCATVLACNQFNTGRRRAQLAQGAVPPPPSGHLLESPLGMVSSLAAATAKTYYIRFTVIDRL